MYKEKQKTIYCGNIKKMSEKWFKGTIKVNKLRDYIKEYNGHELVNININIHDEPDKYGKDGNISVDTWEPDNKKEVAQQKKDYTNLPFSDQDDDDLPF
tara:strand:+ start:419 stop:715 length:297 start_codon:yes stop_codon:yes gene_type:complete